MRVVTLVGSRAGDVIDFPVLVARAMLADGRATLTVDVPETRATRLGPLGVTPAGVVVSRDPVSRRDRGARR